MIAHPVNKGFCRKLNPEKHPICNINDLIDQGRCLGSLGAQQQSESRVASQSARNVCFDVGCGEILES